jgi:hypothetical protein
LTLREEVEASKRFCARGAFIHLTAAAVQFLDSRHKSAAIEIGAEGRPDARGLVPVHQKL